MKKSLLVNATLLALAATTLTAGPEKPNGRVERDDPTARREAMRQWYENGVSVEYKKNLNRAAARERAKYGAESLGVTNDPNFTTGSTGDTSTPIVGGTWSNIGPTGSNYIQNGSYTLNKVDAGRVRDIVPVPGSNVVYVAFSGGGVWRTSDASVATPSWTPVTDSVGSLSVGALAIDPATTSGGSTSSLVMYLGLGDPFDGTGVGLLKSVNGGASWDGFTSAANVQYLGSSSIITKILVTSTGGVYVATDKGLFFSANGATGTFAQVALGTLVNPYVWDVEKTATGYVASLEANPTATSGTTDGQVWYTSGGAWARATGVTKTTGVGRISLATNGATVYAMAAVPNATSSADLADFFRSTTNGSSFTALSATGTKIRYTNSNTESTGPKTVLNGQGWYDHMLIAKAGTPETFYFGGALLMAKAVNNAGWKYTQMTNWLAQFSLPYVHADFHAAAFDSNGVFYVGSDGGVFRSTDGGTTWRDINSGIASHLMYSVGSSTANPNAVIAGLQDNGTRVRVADTGVFNQELGGDGFGSHVHANNASQMLGTLYYTRIYKSTDGGINFASACSGITECNNSSSSPFNTKLTPWLGDATGNTILTHTNSKVYRTTNYAASWASTGWVAPSGVYLRNVGIAQTNGSIVGAVASGGRVYLSTNGGAAFTQVATPPNSDLSMSYVFFVADATATNGQRVYVASVAANPAKNHLWVSSSFGASWTALDRTNTQASNGLPTGVPVNSIQEFGGVLYAGTHLGVYSSSDLGATWSRFGTGMPLVNVTDLYIAPDGSFIRAATFGRSIWHITR